MHHHVEWFDREHRELLGLEAARQPQHRPAESSRGKCSSTRELGAIGLPSPSGRGAGGEGRAFGVLALPPSPPTPLPKGEGSRMFDATAAWPAYDLGSSPILTNAPRQWMSAPIGAHRQLHCRPRSRRFVDRHDHLQRRPPIVDAAARLAVALDRLHQIAHDPHVALAQAAVLERFLLADAGARDLLPVGPTASREPRRVGEKKHRRQTAGRELDDAAAAEDASGHRSLIGPSPSRACSGPTRNARPRRGRSRTSR